MIVGVPTEIKEGENRVAATPAGADALVRHGHCVLIQSGAGRGSGLRDVEYRKAGAVLCAKAEEVWGQADIIVKVKEPLASEFGLMRPGLLIFTYLHLASDTGLIRALLDADVIGLAYETVQTPSGRLPLLTPMSEVAGRLCPQVGAHYLEAHHGGRGTLLPGVPGVAPADVVVIGCGTVGVNAAYILAGMGAQVTMIDLDHDRLKYLDDVMHGRVITLYSTPLHIARALEFADLVIGAVLVAGARAPVVASEEMVASMKQGAVIIDVAVDQGGCIATTRPTTHAKPTHKHRGVVHYAVPNMPAAVPRTATFALTNATLPYVLKLADLGVDRALAEDEALGHGLNVRRGEVCHPAVAEAMASGA